VQGELDFGGPGREPEPEPAAETETVLSWYQSIQGNLDAAAEPVTDPGMSPVAVQTAEDQAEAAPGEMVSWWRGVNGADWAVRPDATVEAVAAESDTPAGPGVVPEPVTETGPEPDADLPQSEAADTPRAAGPASPRGAQPVSAATPETGPERDDAWYAARHDRLDAEREELWREWLGRQAAADADTDAEPEPEPEPDRAAELSARLDELQAQAEQAAARADAEEARQDAGAEYAAHQRQAELDSEFEAQGQAEYDEPEM
jgi:hypothetical protein